MSGEDDHVLNMLAVAVPTIIVSLWVAARALHVARPVPNGHPITFLKNVEWVTGDIVLFHSNAAISLGSSGEWSHVGLVIVGRSDMPFLFEITGTSHYARLAPLIPIVTNELWQGDRVVAMRRIHPPPDERAIKEYVRECIRRRVCYEHVYWRTFYRRIFGWLFPIGIDDSEAVNRDATVCSSLIAAALQHVGVISDEVHPYGVLPYDFGDSTDVPLVMANGYALGPVTFLRILFTGQK